jgi:predicted HTH domain antitoxin
MNIPDELVSSIPANSDDLARAGLELFVLEAYRLGNISDRAAARLLGLQTQFDFHALLGERGLCVNYGIEEFESDTAALDSLGI